MLKTSSASRPQSIEIDDTSPANKGENASLSDPRFLDALKRLNNDEEMTAIDIQNVCAGALIHMENGKLQDAFEIYIKLADKGNLDALVNIRGLLLNNRNIQTLLIYVRNYCEIHERRSIEPTAYTYVRAFLYQHGLFYVQNLETAKSLYEKVVPFFSGLANYPALKADIDQAMGENDASTLALGSVSNTENLSFAIQDEAELQRVVDEKCQTLRDTNPIYLAKEAHTEEIQKKRTHCFLELLKISQNADYGVNFPTLVKKLKADLIELSREGAFKQLHFDQENLTDLDFSDLNLTESRFENSKIENVRFQQVSLRSVTFNKVAIKKTSFLLTGLVNSSFINVTLDDVNMSLTDLRLASFYETKASTVTDTDGILLPSECTLSGKINGGALAADYPVHYFLKYSLSSIVEDHTSTPDFSGANQSEGVVTTTTTTTTTTTSTTSANPQFTEEDDDIASDFATVAPERERLAQARRCKLQKDLANQKKALDLYIGLVDKGNDTAETELQMFVSAMDIYSESFIYLNDTLANNYKSPAAITMCHAKKQRTAISDVRYKYKPEDAQIIAKAYYTLGMAFNEAKQNYFKASLFFLDATFLGLEKKPNYLVGMMYLEGRHAIHQNEVGSVKKNIASALNYLTRASKAGDEDASFQLGMLYLEGKEIGKNHPKAREYFMLADRLGHLEAAFYCGQSFATNDILGKGDPDQAEHWYGIAHEKGHPNAAYYCANFFAKASWRSGDQNSVKAEHWYGIAHEKGHPKAAYYCANFFAKASWKSGDQNSVKAEHWYGIAAITPGKKQVEAQKILEKDYAESYLGKASSTKDANDKAYYLTRANAGFTLGMIFLNRNIVNGRSHAKARLLLTQADKDGHPSAKFYLGQSYETTDYNGKPDLIKAKQCYEEAMADVKGNKQKEAKAALVALTALIALTTSPIPSIDIETERFNYNSL